MRMKTRMATRMGGKVSLFEERGVPTRVPPGKYFVRIRNDTNK
jgi:hypothetical protein